MFLINKKAFKPVLKRLDLRLKHDETKMNFALTAEIKVRFQDSFRPTSQKIAALSHGIFLVNSNLAF